MKALPQKRLLRAACRKAVAARALGRVLALMLVAGTFAVVGALPAQAQQPDVRLSSDRPPAVVTTGVYYQRYILGGERHIREISFPITAAVPIGRSTAMSLRASPAMVAGQDLTAVSGLSDAQLSLSHARRFGESSVVVNLGLNLPSGKRALTQEEFETTVQLSRNFYDFRTPTFGQGLNVSPGITWAFPLGDRIVLGLGAAYQYKGGFKPMEGLHDKYHPGAEVLLTGGLDVQVMPAAAISGDVTYTRYGTDRIGGDDVFDAGDQVVTTIQYLQYYGFDEIRVIGRYRSRGKGSLAAPGRDPAAALQTLADQLDLYASYRMETSASTSIGLHGGIYYFGASDVFSSKLIFNLGASPEMSLSSSVSLWTRFSVRLGNFAGMQAGTGLAVNI